MDLIEKSLFKTESIKVAAPDKPFWYTSGTLGPFFINTHFLYGNEKSANELLDFINISMSDVKNFIKKLEKKIIDFYKNNELYKSITDDFYTKLLKQKEFNNCAYISGGERRDWFFSFIISHLSGKKHLYIYKNLNVYSSDDNEIKNINNAKVCHICDLITQASSFKRGWIPAIQNIKGQLAFTASVVDRDQGGIEFLKENKTETFACVKINDDFFNKALSNKIINEKQFELINNFKNNPDDYGKNFIINNPDFILYSLDNPATRSKALTCIKDNPYKIDFKSLLGDKLKNYE